MELKDLMPLIEEAGAVKAGVAPLEPVDDREFAYYERWLAEERHGSMAYLANHLEIRRNPSLLLTPGALTPAPSEQSASFGLERPPAEEQRGGSILSFAFPYFSGKPYREGGLRWARYALGDDYHEVLRARLRPVAVAITAATGLEARICVDSAPILERYWAVRAGLGYIGRNRQLIVPGFGSHLLLAEIVTYADIRMGEGASGVESQLKSCLECGACLRGCPAGALSTDGFDARRCLSYLTIEDRRSDAELPPRKYFYGCDLCLDACPLATPAMGEGCLPEFEPRSELLELTPERIAAMQQYEFSGLFRHSAIKRIKLAGLKHLAGDRLITQICRINNKSIF